jgi:uncharacterized protein with FMN-binding domain
MKKIIASVAFAFLFGTYALFQNAAAQGQQGQQTPPIAVASTAPTAAPAAQTVASAATAPQGKYRNGTYTGASVSAYYGNVQVQVTVAGGKIADVAFLDYPQDRSASRSISASAMPQLVQEAIAAQSADVNGVSGATDISLAFRQSLSSALSQAA